MTNYLTILAIYIIEIFLIGSGPTLLFKDILNIRSIYKFIVFSVFFGMIFFNLTLLSIGHLGLQVIDQNFVLVKLLLVVLSGFIVFITYWHKEKISKSKIKHIFIFDYRDLIFVIPFILLFSLLIVINTKVIVSATDHFSFWLTDAKIIYETGKLRIDNSIIGQFSYSSYYPLHALTIYEEFGEIREQYASIFSIFYLGFASIITYSTVGKSLLQKIFTTSLIFIIDLSLLQFSLRYYSDIALTAMCTTFFLLFLYKVKTSRQFYKKAFLILIVLFIISIMKSSSIMYSLALLVIFLIEEKKNLKKYLKLKLIKKCSGLIISLYSYLLFIIFARLFYIYHIYHIKDADGTSSKFFENAISYLRSGNFKAWVDQFFYLLSIIYKFHPYVYILFFIFLGIFFLCLLFRKKYKLPSTTILLGAGVAILPFINVLYYTITLGFSSIPRYVTTAFFGIIIFMSILFLTIRKWDLQILLSLTTIIIVIFYSTNSKYLGSFYRSRTLPDHNGQYTQDVSFASIKNTADKIQSKVGDEPIYIYMAIGKKSSDGSTRQVYSNEAFKVYVLRYYLINNFTGGAYRTDYNGFIDKLEEDQIKYVVFIDSQIFFEDYPKKDELNSVYNLIYIKSYDPFEYKLIDYKNSELK